jgi:hypothetical protein
VRFKSIIFASVLSVLLLSLLSCASIGGGKISGVNWALRKNGGRVTAFSEEPDHPVSTLINGITSSKKWNQGEGWAAPITIGSRSRSRQARRSDEESRWVIIDLAQPVTVNNVKIHTIDSEEFPAREFGLKSVLVQYELETASKEMIWATADRYGKGVGDKDNIIRDNINGVIDVRFKPVNTKRIRLLIYSTNDLKRTGDESGTQQGVIRLTEVEVYGMGKLEGRDELEMMFDE